MEEKYPPDTRVKRVDPSTNMLLVSTVMDIPFPIDVTTSDNDCQYSILLDNGTTNSMPLSDMANMIPAPPVCKVDANMSNPLLPLFLKLNYKITYEHNGQFHKWIPWDMPRDLLVCIQVPYQQAKRRLGC
jgi:hypothetical protein